MARNYDRLCDYRILLFTEIGLQLNVQARDALERRSYERLAKDNLKPMTRGLSDSHGAVVAVDNETQTTTTTWSKLGMSPGVKKHILAWLKANGSKQLIADWTRKNS
jgi:hypothetical protein